MAKVPDRIDDDNKFNELVSNKTESIWQNWMSSTNDNLVEDIKTTSTPAPPPAASNTAVSSAIIDITRTCNTYVATSASSSLVKPMVKPNHNENLVDLEDPKATPTTAPPPAASAAICHTCDNHDHSHTCQNTAATQSQSADNGTQTHIAGGSTNGSTNGSSSGPVRRYCPCCDCDLFQQNSKTRSPTSHNYTKQRDKMRQKLEKRRNKKDGECPRGYPYPVPHHSYHSHSPPTNQSNVKTHPAPPPPPPALAPAVETKVATPPTPPSIGDDRSLDELLRFIEGKDFVEPTSNENKTKKKNKKKKVTESVAVSSSSSGNDNNQSHVTINRVSDPPPPPPPPPPVISPSPPPPSLPAVSKMESVGGKGKAGGGKGPAGGSVAKREEKGKAKQQALVNGGKKGSPSPPVTKKQTSQPSPKPTRSNNASSRSSSKKTSHQSNGIGKGDNDTH
ncbi:PREDICTED: myb-related transcription factor, partner of profilin-like [Amphimedon queenslandica]|uniref:Uncharacterized protein n=1 Tax=Amphimedon queenslandica TaxID=400682 RepID=A0A1X7V826_AMPQE|nr:PREDICTED: myb-related transcription factor, partner of profilin-like [Amphimedon queenslandica]|eukprot:XP_019850165.1 PREDICTED: myb-related transcription factor, partner of profilin-like [Amphimedon queenslandica]